MNTQPLSVAVTDNGVSHTITLDMHPVPQSLSQLVADHLNGFEAIVRDPVIPPLDKATVPDYPDGRTSATAGALLAKHCATQIRDYILHADAQISNSLDSSRSEKAHAFAVWLEWTMQSARLESALRAYRTMRLTSDAVQTCERVLRMMDFIASETEGS